MSEHGLGGRVAILRPELMSDEQKQAYERIHENVAPGAAKAGFQAMSDDGGIIGPYNSQLLSPGTALGYLDMVDAEAKNSSLSKRVREVVILSVGAVWKSGYEIYAHSAIGRTVGLSEMDVEALAAGDLPAGLAEEEKIAQRYARQLALEHRVDGGLYAEAEQTFGLRGLADMVYLIGIYQIVCAFLNAFEVPVPGAAAAASPSVDRKSL
jgi:4-carboxymuconolactone decarboxylase